MWIGVALGLLVVLGLLVLGVYFYMKQRALQSAKPPPYSDRNRNSNGYAGGGLYASQALSNGNDRHVDSNSKTFSLVLSRLYQFDLKLFY